MSRVLRLVVLSIVLYSGVSLTGGCAARREQPEMIETTTIERPAEPLEDEESFADRVGEVGIVILVVAIAVGGILVPLLLF